MHARRFALWLFASPLFVSLPAIAQNALTVPMEIVRVNNPDLTAESRGSVTLYRLNPQYTLQMPQDSSRLELSLGGLIERSSNTDLSAHRSLPSVRMLWETSDPVSVFGLQASLEEVSTRETEFADFGRVARDSTERTGLLGGTWTRRLTAGSSLDLLVSHARVSFDTPSLLDYSESLGSTAYRLESSPVSRYTLSAKVSELKPDGVAENASRVEFGVGYEVDLREGVRLNAAGGAVRTKALQTKTDPVGALRLTYTGERIGYSVGWAREVSAGGTLAGYELSERLEASLTYPFSVDTSLALGFGHARSLEDDGDAGMTAYARIRSELTRFWAFTFGLEQRRSKPSSGTTARGNVVSVGLVYSHPDF